MTHLGLLASTSEDPPVTVLRKYDFVPLIAQVCLSCGDYLVRLARMPFAFARPSFNYSARESGGSSLFGRKSTKDVGGERRRDSVVAKEEAKKKAEEDSKAAEAAANFSAESH